jgi:drug/metabolite transporter (DMT)-like permease
MSAGIVLAKIGLAKAPALQATFIRLLWGSVGLWAWGTASGQILVWLTPFKNIRLLRLILGSIAVVIFGGFWLSLVSLKYITASVSTILCSTTPLWILPISFFLLKEKISKAEIAGAILAVCGIVLIFIG